MDLAALLDVTPVLHGHYTVTRPFGPLVYDVSAAPQTRCAGYDARRSYDTNITIPKSGEPMTAA